MTFRTNRARYVVGLVGIALYAGAEGVPPDRALVVTAIADDVASVVLEDGSSEADPKRLMQVLRAEPLSPLPARIRQ